MKIKIVTDSSADLPPQLAQELGITVVPLYVRFGNEVYRDRVDISEDEFYHRLEHDPVHPSTTQPTPQDFADVYRRLSPEADEIVSIHISGKLSGTCNSALQGREMAASGSHIEVVDSLSVSMGLGLIAMAAAKIAKTGEGLSGVMEEVKQAIPDMRLFGLLDTLRYLLLGGRIGKAKALLGSILKVKPVLTLKDGEVVPAGQVRTRGKGMDKLVDFVKSAINIQDLAIAYTTTLNEAQTLKQRLGSIFTEERINLARVGPVLGVHLGPGAVVVALREKAAA